MIAYTDNNDAKKLHNYIENTESNRKYFSNEVKRLFDIKEDIELIGIKSFYWKIGTHYNSPLKDYKNRDEFLAKARNPQKNIFVIGEDVSKDQGWSNCILDEFNYIKL